jgi:hypothetical protein
MLSKGRFLLFIVFQLVSLALIGQHTLDFVIPPCPHVGISDTRQPVPGISVTPNPASTNLTIRLENIEGLQHSRVKLFNTWGRLVFERNFSILTQNIILDVSYFPSGIYILQIMADAMLFNEKIVIRNE